MVSILCVIFFQAPRWVYLFCAIGLFVYQSLDAIDGKQARRTNTNTPLGELFDHGCDSLSTGEFSLNRGIRYHALKLNSLAQD